ncbi:MAG TPA: hypothetical protein VED66_03250 [Candidatus Sulfotelmatobacter sp.]|nr:hypothetical protein [Candidatus Sulfotelmatobacter sp.]
MGDHDYERTKKQELARDDLDRVLDAALAKYAALEPRAGLEQRILAGLRTAPQSAVRVWWSWAPAAGAAAVVIVAMALAWRSGTTRPPEITKHPQAGAPTVPAGPQIAQHDGNFVGRPTNGSVRKAAPRWPTAAEVVAAVPRLDVFPSPQPPSDEELALARYVRNFPADARVVAEAQANSEREVLAKMQALANESRESN